MATTFLDTAQEAPLRDDEGRRDRSGPEPAASDLDRFDLAASLLGFQGLLLIVTAAEAGIMALSGQAAGLVPVISSLVVAAFSLIARVRLRKGKARRAVRIFQWSLLVWAAIDLALALWLASAVLPIVGMITRIAMPVSVLVLTRRSK